MNKKTSFISDFKAIIFAVLLTVVLILPANSVFARTPAEIRNLEELNISQDMSSQDLSGNDFVKLDLKGINFSESNLSNVQRYGLDGYNLKKIDVLEKDSIAKDEKIAALENRLAIIEAQLAGIDNANLIKELVEQVAELQKRPTIEQVRDARAGSVVLTVEPDGNNITLGLTIEQSDNLTQWTKLDGEMTRTIPIPEGKKFYRFALDK